MQIFGSAKNAHRFVSDVVVVLLSTSLVSHPKAAAAEDRTSFLQLYDLEKKGTIWLVPKYSRFYI